MEQNRQAAAHHDLPGATTPEPLISESLLYELRMIRQGLERLNSSPAIRASYSVYRVMMVQFFKGIFLGLGSVIGATLVVSMVVYLLSNIEFIPIIGDVVKKILVEIQR